MNFLILLNFGITFLKKLGQYSIISDLTCYDGEALCNEIPTLFGAIATAFPSPKKSVEFFAQKKFRISNGS